MRRHSAVVAVAVVLTLASLVGAAGAVSGPSERVATPDDGRTAAVSQSVVVDCTAANTSLSDSYEGACEEFRAANASVRNASASLNETTAEINSTGVYTNETHSVAMTDLREMQAGRDRLDRAYANLTDIVLTSQLTPAQQFLLLRSFERRYTATETEAAALVERYNSTVVEREAKASSTVRQYFGGAGAVSLVVGLVLGAFVPIREARNVTEQMRLSSNVSYNRRAGLVPLAVGVGLTLAGLATLWVLGATGILGILI